MLITMIQSCTETPGVRDCLSTDEARIPMLMFHYFVSSLASSCKELEAHPSRFSPEMSSDKYEHGDSIKLAEQLFEVSRGVVAGLTGSSNARSGKTSVAIRSTSVPVRGQTNL